MALRLKDNRSRNLKLTSGAVVIGTAFLLFKTYPHIKNSIFGFLGCEKELPREDNEPIELKEDEEDKEEEEFDNLAESSLVDVGSWTDDNLKSWLTQKDINPPQNASHNNLVSIVKSMQEDSN